MKTQVRHKENESCILQARWPKPRLVLIKTNHCLGKTVIQNWKHMHCRQVKLGLRACSNRLLVTFIQSSRVWFLPESDFPKSIFPDFPVFPPTFLSLAFIKEKSNRRIFQSFWKVSKKRNVLEMKILIR